MVCPIKGLRHFVLIPLFLLSGSLLSRPGYANTSPSASTVELFGAIAYSPSTKVSSTGSAWVEAAAKGQALYQCVLQSQANDCRIQLSFSNGYGALALSSNDVIGRGISKINEYPNPDPDHEKLAIQQALTLCKKAGGQRCRVISIQSAVRYPLLELDLESVLQAQSQESDS